MSWLIEKCCCCCPTYAKKIEDMPHPHMPHLPHHKDPERIDELKDIEDPEAKVKSKLKSHYSKTLEMNYTSTADEKKGRFSPFRRASQEDENVRVVAVQPLRLEHEAADDLRFEAELRSIASGEHDHDPAATPPRNYEKGRGPNPMNAIFAAPTDSDTESIDSYGRPRYQSLNTPKAAPKPESPRSYSLPPLASQRNKSPSPPLQTPMGDRETDLRSPSPTQGPTSYLAHPALASAHARETSSFKKLEDEVTSPVVMGSQHKRQLPPGRYDNAHGAPVGRRQSHHSIEKLSPILTTQAAAHSQRHPGHEQLQHAPNPHTHNKYSHDPDNQFSPIQHQGASQHNPAIPLHSPVAQNPAAYIYHQETYGQHSDRSLSYQPEQEPPPPPPLGLPRRPSSGQYSSSRPGSRQSPFREPDTPYMPSSQDDERRSSYSQNYSHQQPEPNPEPEPEPEAEPELEDIPTTDLDPPQEPQEPYRATSPWMPHYPAPQSQERAHSPFQNNPSPFQASPDATGSPRSSSPWKSHYGNNNNSTFDPPSPPQDNPNTTTGRRGRRRKEDDEIALVFK